MRFVSDIEKPFMAIEVTSEEVGGSFEKMLRRFTRRVKDDGVLGTVNRRARGFRKPSEVHRAAKVAPR